MMDDGSRLLESLIALIQPDLEFEEGTPSPQMLAVLMFTHVIAWLDYCLGAHEKVVVEQASDLMRQAADQP